MLAFTLSLDDLVIASFTTGPGSATLPIRIYSEVRLGVKPEINAICTLVIGADRGGDRRRLAGLEALERAGRERRAVVVAPSFRDGALAPDPEFSSKPRVRCFASPRNDGLAHDFTAPAVRPPTM